MNIYCGYTLPSIVRLWLANVDDTIRPELQLTLISDTTNSNTSYRLWDYNSRIGIKVDETTLAIIRHNDNIRTNTAI